jgi:hypothetical protein
MSKMLSLTRLAQQLQLRNVGRDPSGASSLLFGTPAVAHRLCCLDFHGVDVRHATSSAFKDILDTKVSKSRRSSEPHNSSAARAKRQSWRVFVWEFVAHGQSPRLRRSQLHRRGYVELMTARLADLVKCKD